MIQNYGQTNSTIPSYYQWRIQCDSQGEYCNVQVFNTNEITQSKPSQQAFNGYFVVFTTFICPDGDICNYFDFFDFNVTPLPPDADPVSTTGLPWWVYVLITLGLGILIIILILFYFL